MVVAMIKVSPGENQSGIGSEGGDVQCNFKVWAFGQGLKSTFSSGK